MLCLSGNASPSVVVVASAHRRHRLPSRRFRCNRNASAPKRFRRRFAFLSPGYTSPFWRLFSFRHRRSLSSPSLSPSFATIHPSWWFRCNCDASAPKGFQQHFAFLSPGDALPFRRCFTFRRRCSLSLPSPSSSFTTIQTQSRRFSSQTLPVTLCLP